MMKRICGTEKNLWDRNGWRESVGPKRMQRIWRTTEDEENLWDRRVSVGPMRMERIWGAEEDGEHLENRKCAKGANKEDEEGRQR